MGDRVAVMSKGLLQQVAPPQVLYDTPANLFVAAFIGSPAMNLLKAQLEQRGERHWVVFADSAIGSRPSRRGSPRSTQLGRQRGRLRARPEHLIDWSLEAATDPDTHPDHHRRPAGVARFGGGRPLRVDADRVVAERRGSRTRSRGRAP